MKNKLISIIEQESLLKKELPQFAVGDTVKVWVKVVEGSRERLQAFEACASRAETADFRRPLRDAECPSASAWSAPS